VTTQTHFTFRVDTFTRTVPNELRQGLTDCKNLPKPLTGFHSRVSFCASAICAGVILLATSSRCLAANSEPNGPTGIDAVDKFNHMYALT
jgi:hypothetical protein